MTRIWGKHQKDKYTHFHGATHPRSPFATLLSPSPTPASLLPLTCPCPSCSSLLLLFLASPLESPICPASPISKIKDTRGIKQQGRHWTYLGGQRLGWTSTWLKRVPEFGAGFVGALFDMKDKQPKHLKKLFATVSLHTTLVTVPFNDGQIMHLIGALESYDVFWCFRTFLVDVPLGMSIKTCNYRQRKKGGAKTGKPAYTPPLPKEKS